MSKNNKYEITDVSNEVYPWLHRIRALRDIGSEVKVGDLGGFVESESNLSFESGDEAWIADNAIACNTAYVDKDALLKNNAVACDQAYVTGGAVLSDQARAEDDSYVCNASIMGGARASGCSIIRSSPTTGKRPVLSGACAVYGRVVGNVNVEGKTLILASEDVFNDTPDTFVLRDSVRFVVRAPSRDTLKPAADHQEHQKKKSREQSR